MASFGDLVLVCGDSHVPYRTSKIHQSFRRMLVPNKMQHVICTGNISNEQYEEFRNLSPNLHMVGGDYDVIENQNQNSNNGMMIFPETRVVQVGAFRIGVIHGHQLLPWKNNNEPLARMRRKLNVDILISGHTHQNQVTPDGPYYYINPGSITGASSSLTENVTPSFILLAVQDTKIVCYVYELINDEVEVTKTEINKEQQPTLQQQSTGTDPALLSTLLT